MKRLIVFSILMLVCSSALAEDLTITTYYPSPYGSYNQLSTNKFLLSGIQAPDNNGSIIFNTVLSASPTPSGKTGELAFFGAQGFKYYNGSTWVNIGGAGELTLDSSNNSSATLVGAASSCRAKGGHLPSVDELARFLGISGATGAFLWTTTPWWSGGSGQNYTTLRIDNSVTGVSVLATESRPYRCVYN